MRVFRWAVALALTLGGATRAAADEAYYVVVFGAQRTPIKSPRYSHTWASFVHERADGTTEVATLSWLPATGEVRPYALRPEQGRNFSLEETLCMCRSNRMEVTIFGPYRICPELYQSALMQIARLEGGQVSYQAYDFGGKDGIVMNCLHALAHTAPSGPQRGQWVIVAPGNWGVSASYWTALVLRPWFIEPCVIHDAVLAKLGLNACEYQRAGLDRNPIGNPVTRAIQAAVHPHLLHNRVICD